MPQYPAKKRGWGRIVLPGDSSGDDGEFRFAFTVKTGKISDGTLANRASADKS